jgi:methyl-accepting chemotaxis protein
MLDKLRDLNLSIKFITPIILATLLAMSIGAIFIINIAKSSGQRQADTAKQVFLQEQKSSSQAQITALHSKADIIGKFMAKTAADFILSYDFSSLQAFQTEAASDKEVAYAAYLKPDGKPLTQYKKPADTSQIIEKKYPIINDGKTIGYILLGMSKANVTRNIEESNKRIATAIVRVNEVNTESMNRFYTVMGIDMAAIIIMLSAIVIVLFGYNVVKPLKETTELINGLAKGNGDLTVQLPIASNDEIGQMRQAVNSFVDSLRNMISIIAMDVNSLTTQAGDVNHVSTDLSSHSDNQRHQTTQVATAMTQMTATVQEVARNVIEAANAADHGRQEATQGKEIVNSAVNSIHTLSQEIETTADVISRLAKNSEQIGTVLEVINGIAEQTNLLALNAAIEAARAGEQGRGFAVVADEVRTLASRTHESTLEIRDMIDRVQTGTSEAVSAMEQGQDAARNSVDTVEQAGRSLETIMQTSAQINDMTTQIAGAAEEQSATMESINENIDSIHQISEETANSAETAARSSTELTELANRLNGLVSQFRT